MDGQDLEGTEAEAAIALSRLDDDALIKVLRSALQDRASSLQALADWIVPDLAYPTSRVMTSRLIGTIKSFSAQSGFGFVTSPEIIGKFGKDIFLSIKQITGRGHSLDTFPVGARISFVVVLEKGKGTAYDIAPLDADPRADGFGSLRSRGSGRMNAYASGPRRYTAPVKSYNAEKGFGFLDCKELEYELGKADIFVHKTQIEHLADFRQGQLFSFTLGDDGKGKPMAIDLIPLSSIEREWSTPPLQRNQRALPRPVRYTAPVKSYNVQKKFGFLECKELEHMLGKADIFVHVTQIEHLANFQPGQLFSFTLGDDGKGKPMAIDLTPVSLDHGDWSAAPASQGSHGSVFPADIVGKRYSAPVKSFNFEKKFGFLECCGELCEIMGKSDMFVHATQISNLDGFASGQVYSFTVGVDPKGQLMAVDLVLEEEGNRCKRPRLGWPD